jgi:hypothetical protein
MPYLLVVAIAIATMQARAYPQALSTQQGTTLPHSTSALERIANSESAATIQDGPSPDHETTPCSLRVPDTIPQSSRESPAGADVANLPLTYAPLSTRCKFTLFVKQTYSPYTFVSAAFQASLDQAQDQWPQYGGGIQGWGKRFGATLADTELRRFIQGYALSTILHQDPRYFPSHQRTLISRAWYAATRVAVTRNDNGDSVFNTSELLGALFASSLQNAYYPSDARNFGETINRFGGALSSDATGSLLREFTPDIKRLFQKHAPKKILKIEEKLPIPAEDKP